MAKTAEETLTRKNVYQHLKIPVEMKIIPIEILKTTFQTTSIAMYILGMLTYKLESDVSLSLPRLISRLYCTHICLLVSNKL